jgi:predicted transcriptional regulator
LRDAVLIESTAEDPAAPYTRAFDWLQEATEYRGLTHTSFPNYVKTLRDHVERNHLTFEHVIEKAYVETIRTDPEQVAAWTDLSDLSEGIWLYDGVIPISLHIIDGTVLVWLGKTRGEVAGLLESENSEVLSWAESLYTEYRSEAEPF